MFVDTSLLPVLRIVCPFTVESGLLWGGSKGGRDNEHTDLFYEGLPFWAGLGTTKLTTSWLRTKERPRVQCDNLASVFITLDLQGRHDSKPKHCCIKSSKGLISGNAKQRFLFGTRDDFSSLKQHVDIVSGRPPPFLCRDPCCAL